MNARKTNPEGVPHWFATQWALCLLKVSYAGRYTMSARNPQYSRKRRDHWMYLAVHEGTIRIKTFAFDRTLQAGQHAILPPYRSGEYRAVGDPKTVSATEIGINVQPFLRSGNPLTRLGLPAVLPQPRGRRLRDRLRHIENCFSGWKRATDLAALQARGWIELVLLEYVQQGFAADAFTGAATELVPPWVQALADRLSTDCPNPDLRPQALHRLSGFSRSYVNAMFRKYVGETPREYLHRCRVRLAMERLTGNPEVPLAEVAEICGYSTQSLFNRHFRRLTGMTPGQFRSSQSGKRRTARQRRK